MTVLAILVLGGFIALLAAGIVDAVPDRLGPFIAFAWALLAVALAIVVLT
jgi:Mg2+/citrate symporter